MSDKNTDNELSMDELKDVSGGLKGGGGSGGRKGPAILKGDRVSPNQFVGNPYPALKEDICIGDDSDGNDLVRKI